MLIKTRTWMKQKKHIGSRIYMAGFFLLCRFIGICIYGNIEKRVQNENNCYKGDLKMSNMKTTILGIFTVLPILFFIISYPFFTDFIRSIESEAYTSDQDVATFFLMASMVLMVLILIFVLMRIYKKDVAKNPNIEESKRPLWVTLIFFGNLLTMPVYWYLYIWKHRESNK